MFGYCGGLRAVTLFVNRSAMFVEAVLKFTFGFSYVLFVTVVTLHHVDNVFGVEVNVMITKSSFSSRTKCIISKSVNASQILDLGGISGHPNYPSKYCVISLTQGSVHSV